MLEIYGPYIVLAMVIGLGIIIWKTPEHKGPEFKIDPEKAARSRDYYFDFEKGEVVYIDYVPYEG